MSGSQKIRDKLAVLNGASFDLETGGTHCVFQPTSNSGVLIMVSGLVSLRDPNTKELGAPTRFVQTFLLESEENSRYSIVNDLHTFLDPVSLPATTSTSAVSVPQPTPVSNGAGESNYEVVKAEETKEPIQPIQETEPSMEIPAAAPSSQSSKPAKAQFKPHASADQTEAIPPKPTGPPSYAQAAAKKNNGSPSTIPNLPTPTLVQPTKEKEPASQRHVNPSPPLGTGIFIKNIGKATESNILELFNKFGKIESIAINPQKGTAVVTFFDPKEASSALNEKDISFEGIPLQIESQRGGRARRGSSGKQSSSQAVSGNQNNNNGDSSSKQRRPRNRDKQGGGGMSASGANLGSQGTTGNNRGNRPERGGRSRRGGGSSDHKNTNAGSATQSQVPASSS